MRVSIVRGGFANPFELQNFYPLKKDFDIQVIASRKPLSSSIDLTLTKLFSPTDLPNFLYKYPILNRLFVDAHYLFNLEKNIFGSDIIHVAETYYNYTHQAIKAKQKGLVKKIVSTCWEVIPHNNEGIAGRKRFKKLAYKHIDHFITPTKLAKDTLIIEGVPSNKITVISMGINLSKFRSVKKLKNKKWLDILFIGRFVEEKGLRELIAAFLLLSKEFKSVKLTLIGSGPLESIIPNDPKIIFKSVPYHLIHKEYAKADIFCLPSKKTVYWQEQFGMVLVEAMACGLPIVTTDTGAIKEVVENAGIYAKPTATSLYKNLKKLITNHQLRIKLSKLAITRAKLRYDHRKTASKIARLYKNVA
jgi:glycosyltransferase involved in cell wall biosynthesis